MKILFWATKESKEKGVGAIDCKPQIHDKDVDKITKHFEMIMQSPPNPAALQVIVIFYIIYYIGWRG